MEAEFLSPMGTSGACSSQQPLCPEQDVLPWSSAGRARGEQLAGAQLRLGVSFWGDFYRGKADE